VPLTFEWLTMVVIPAVAILLVIFVVWHHQLQQRQIRQLAERIANLSAQQPNQGAELEELRSGVIGIGHRILQLEQALQNIESNQQALASELEQLTEHQQKIQLFDPDSRLYSRAVKMVQLGAGLEEVMSECELPRAEAETLDQFTPPANQLIFCRLLDVTLLLTTILLLMDLLNRYVWLCHPLPEFLRQCCYF